MWDSVSHDGFDTDHMAAEYDVMERVSRNIRRLRYETGLPVRVVAARGGLGLRTWQKAETDTSNTTMMTLAKVAVGLGVDVSELFKPVKR